MKELNVTPFDLLVKWLGPVSSRNALSIRISNPNDPARDLKKIWERLEEHYGCPEMVESALKYKLANFPKLTNKENKNLYELSDILAEVEPANENKKYQALLAYFDSSSCVINFHTSYKRSGLQKQSTISDKLMLPSLHFPFLLIASET